MSKIYEVRLDFSGYSRGYEVRMIEANSPEEASENWYGGEVEREGITRDDRDFEVGEVKEVDNSGS